MKRTKTKESCLFLRVQTLTLNLLFKNFPSTSILSAHIALFLVALFYGANYFIAKGIFAHIPPLGMVAVRSISGILFFGLIHQIFIREKIRERSDYWRLFICGIFGASLNQMFFFLGLSRTTEVNASIFMITSPLFVFIIAVLLKAEKMTWLKVAGLVVSFLGAAFLSLRGRELSINDATVLGDLFIILNAAVYAYYLVLVRPLMVKYHVFTIVMWVFIFGGTINILVGSPYLWQLDWATVPDETYLRIWYVILFGTIGTYLLNAVALSRVSSSAVGAYIYLQPVIVGLISLLWFNELISGEKALYMVMVVLGVFIVSYRKNTN
jgi:drug/metabolite transporter (DMT)-like permease